MTFYVAVSDCFRVRLHVFALCVDFGGLVAGCMFLIGKLINMWGRFELFDICVAFAHIVY